MDTLVFGIAEVLRSGVVTTQLRIEAIGLRGSNVAIAGATVICDWAQRGRYDTFIVPGMEISRHVDGARTLAPLGPEIAFMRKAYVAGIPVAPVCLRRFCWARRICSTGARPRRPGCSRRRWGSVMWTRGSTHRRYCRRMAWVITIGERLRRVQSETGQSPLGLLQAARVDKAK